MSDSTNMIKKPLQGIRVLEMGISLSAPYCTLLLAGLGAEVIKIEPLPDGDRVRDNSPYLGSRGIDFSDKSGDNLSLSYLARNRNKKSITLNLKAPEGKEILLKLASIFDVFVENNRPGTTDRLGIGYRDMEKVNPRLIYASISGFGQEGRRRNMRAYDSIIQALSGIMDATGFPDGPPTRIGVALADMTSPLYTTIAILAALQYRNQTGIGQYIDVAMLDSMIPFTSGEHYEIFARNNIPTRTGNYIARLPLFGLYQAKDGYFALTVLTEEETKTLFEVMKQEDVLLDERFNSTGNRVKNAAQLIEIFENWTRTKTISELLAELTAHGVVCSSVTLAKDINSDPDLIERKAIVPLPHPQLEKTTDVMTYGMPYKFSKTPVEYDSPAPVLGQHNEEVLCDMLGYAREDLDRLKVKGVI